MNHTFLKLAFLFAAFRPAILEPDLSREQIIAYNINTHDPVMVSGGSRGINPAMAPPLKLAMEFGPPPGQKEQW